MLDDGRSVIGEHAELNEKNDERNGWNASWDQPSSGIMDTMMDEESLLPKQYEAPISIPTEAEVREFEDEDDERADEAAQGKQLYFYSHGAISKSN